MSFVIDAYEGEGRQSTNLEDADAFLNACMSYHKKESLFSCFGIVVVVKKCNALSAVSH
jgi:hypothetical protein